MMTYPEFEEYVKQNIDFTTQLICFECTDCGDKHYHGGISKFMWIIRYKSGCARCRCKEIKVYGIKDWTKEL